MRRIAGIRMAKKNIQVLGKACPTIQHSSRLGFVRIAFAGRFATKKMMGREFLVQQLNRSHKHRWIPTTSSILCVPPFFPGVEFFVKEGRSG
jgi:hypothetical protein